MEFRPLERGLLDALLAGDDPVLESLRAQYTAATVAGRDMTDFGFFLDLSVPAGTPAVSPSGLRIGDVVFELVGLSAGGEAILWVCDGKLSQLEAVSRDASWPDDATLKSVGYFSGSERDLDWLRSSWSD